MKTRQPIFRVNIILFLMLFFALLLTADWVQQVFTLPNILIAVIVILTGVLALVGAKWKPVIQAFLKIPEDLRASIDPNSEGGKKLSEHEIDKLKKDGLDVMQALASVLTGTIIGRILTVLVTVLFKKA